MGAALELRLRLLGCARKYVALLNRPGAGLISSLHYLRSSVLCPRGQAGVSPVLVQRRLDGDMD